MPASIGWRLRSIRSGNSLRIQSNIAVDAEIGASPRTRDTCGITAAIESDEKRKIKNPIMAFQNPDTIQGNVIANNTISMMSIVLKPPGDSASAASAIDPAMVTAVRAANSTRLPAMAFPVASACLDWSGERSNTRLRLLIPGGPCKLDDITQQIVPIVQ